MGWGAGPLGKDRKTITVMISADEHAQHAEFVRALTESGRKYRHWLICAETAALRELRKRHKRQVSA